VPQAQRLPYWPTEGESHMTSVAIRERVKQAGGAWSPERRVWQLRYDRVVAPGLTTRIRIQ
jgi:hypothetical protein